MTEIPIFTKFIIAFFFIAITVIGIYLGLCCLKLNKRNEQLRRDRNNLIESRLGWELEMIRRNPELSDTDKKLILVALSLPEYKREMQGPIGEGLNETYENLIKKIKDSIDV